jgi:rhodanese-related sulfurtransferase
MSVGLEVTPVEARSRLAAAQALLIDVREPEEFALARIDGSHLIPMGSISTERARLKLLAGSSDLLLLCHHGVRSLQAVNWLRGCGIENCFSVAGGIDRWSHEIDPSVPRY